jgi:hypothetical protein
MADDSALHQRGDGGVDLVAAQCQGARCQGTGTGIGGEYIGAAAPGEVALNVLSESTRQICPIDPLGRCAEGDDRDRRESEQFPHLVPDQRHLPVQLLRLAVERALADRGDEPIDHGVVHLLGVNPFGAGIAGETRKAEMCALTRKPFHQTSPSGAQRRLGRALHGLQSADLHRGEEPGAKVSKRLGADPHRDRVDVRQLGANRR